MRFSRLLITACCCFVTCQICYSISDKFRSAIEYDWQLQEERKGRSSSDLIAIYESLERCEKLLVDLSESSELNLEIEFELFKIYKKQINNLESMDEAERFALYKQIRWLIRDISFQNPLIESSPIVFLKRRRFICQMLHEYLGYFYDYRDISGGGVYKLDNPGYSMQTSDLTKHRLPKGNFTTLSLSYDAKSIYFAFAERAEQKPDYYSDQRKCFHIYSMDCNGGNLKQLTDGIYDDFDPCELPGGDVAFMSTRRGGFGRCHNPWEPLPCYTLHRMKSDGQNIKTLSFHETNEWHPSVLHDGRIVYTRWDYIDRSAANFHGLWISNPDGSNPSILFGNYTKNLNACYQPRAIPGSNKIVFVAGAHHADVGGSLVVVDPTKIKIHKKTGEDDFSSLELLTPEVCFPEANGWPNSYFHSPWPLSENYYLVSFSFDPLPGMGPHVDEDTTTGLYLFDRFGNMELLYREEGISSMYPIPLAPRTVPPVVPSALDSNLENEGELLLSDINTSLYEKSGARKIKTLNIFQILPKSETHVANKPRLGYANAESARMLLGSVPVEKDGSAFFRVPASKPILFQAIDDNGKAVQGMRSLIYLQPGEQRGCVGCHETPGTVARNTQPIAFKRKPSQIKPGPDGSLPWNYSRLVQPILDQHCVGCHDGKGKNEKRPNLCGAEKDGFLVSYHTLKPYVKWYEWGDSSIRQTVTLPEEMPSDNSPLTGIISNHIKRNMVKLNNDEMKRLYLWLDGNASFYGTYSEDEQLAQIKGEKVDPPALQ